VRTVSEAEDTDNGYQDGKKPFTVKMLPEGKAFLLDPRGEQARLRPARSYGRAASSRAQARKAFTLGNSAAYGEQTR